MILQIVSSMMGNENKSKITKFCCPNCDAPPPNNIINENGEFSCDHCKRPIVEASNDNSGLGCYKIEFNAYNYFMEIKPHIEQVAKEIGIADVNMLTPIETIALTSTILEKIKADRETG